MNRLSLYFTVQIICMYFQVIALAKIKSFLDSYNHFLFDVY